MLQGRYRLKKSHLTSQSNILVSMAVEPLCYYLYKRRDFESKSIESVPKEESDLNKQRSHILATSVIDYLLNQQVVKQGIKEFYVEVQQQFKLESQLLKQLKQLKDEHKDALQISAKTKRMIDNFVIQYVQTNNYQELCKYLNKSTLNRM